MMTIGRVFGTPLVVKGFTWLPLFELGAWGILTHVAGNRRPDWSNRKRAMAGALTASILFGLEWCHNLAHIAVAKWIGKPADAMRVFLGTPLLIYQNIDDREITPREHLLRASGGPAFNLLTIPFSWLAKRISRNGSFGHYIADFAFGANVILPSLSLLPIPGLDGGSLLKWSLVERGRSIREADEEVKKVNLVVGSGLGATSAVAFRQRKKWRGAILAAFAVISLSIGLGLLREQ